MVKNEAAPDKCPLTGRPFFMEIELAGLMVPTYGGPFDSYTIPEKDETDLGWFICQRYDHDLGKWGSPESFEWEYDIPEIDHKPISEGENIYDIMYTSPHDFARDYVASICLAGTLKNFRSSNDDAEVGDEILKERCYHHALNLYYYSMHKYQIELSAKLWPRK